MPDAIKIMTQDDEVIEALYHGDSKALARTPDTPLVIMIHGFPGNKEAHNNIFKDFESFLNDKKFHTLRFDFCGCGQSGGKAEDFDFKSAEDDLSDIVNWAKEKNYTRFVFISEGMGCAFATMAHIPEVLCHVFLWPMIDMPLIAKEVFNADQIEPQWKKAGYALINDHRVGIALIEDMLKTRLELLLSDIKKPFLVMHGAQDETSPIEQLDLLREIADKRRIEITSFHDGTHGLPDVTHRKMIIYHMMQFIEKYT